MKNPNFFTKTQPSNGARPARPPFAVRLTRALALAGFTIYALAAPHSIAGAWMGLSVVIAAWLWRAISTRATGFKHTPFDLPLWLLFIWTILSAFLSYEPRLSVAKLVSVSVFLIFYVTQAMLTRRMAIAVAFVLTASGVSGVLWSAFELAAGRGVVIARLKEESPLRVASKLSEGDAVWRVNRERVNSVEEIDEAIRRAEAGSVLQLSVISKGEHVEWSGPVVTQETKSKESPSGIEGGGRTRRFRASGWTRHYQTYAEVLQIVAQIALGFALANLLRRKERRWIVLPFAAFALLGAGVAFTAMRTTLAAFALGATVTGLRAAARGRARALVFAIILFALALGAFAVWRTRAGGALALRDASSSMRAEVARVALRRVPQHPFFGHGMDAMQRHWNEWGFPGEDMLHTHSTPLQIAFDRGLPALLFWLWFVAVLFVTALRAERIWRGSDSALTHGLALGATGALAGFAASSIVNYNFGDAEVALLLWWLAGALVVLTRDEDAKAQA